MDSSISISMEIDPEPQERQRTVTRGKGGRKLPFPKTYDPSEKYRKKLSYLAIKAYSPRKPIEGNLIATIRIYVPMLKSFSKKKRDLAERGLIRPGKRPDLSNYIKAIEDSLDKIVWKDDGQIVEYGAGTGKYYSEKPRIEVDVRRWKAEERQEQNPVQ